MDVSDTDVDEVAIENGEWIGDIPNFGDIRLLVRGLQNADWRRMQARMLRAVPANKKVGGELDPDEMDRISIVLLRETVLLGWENLTDKGAPIPYSKELAGTLLAERRRFRDAVTWAATIVGHRSQQAKEPPGNSGSASSGT